MNDEEKLLDEVNDLSDRLRTYQRAYYVDARPLVSDMEYDRLFDRLRMIEGSHPKFRFPDSPTQRVGSDLSSDFPEVTHTIPVLSLDKAYSEPAVQDWISKCEKKEDRQLSFVLEQKIDGISMVLYYEHGVLARAVTRGNGTVGNDVTANVRTIKSVPLRLSKPVDIAVRGEVYLPKADFEALNNKLEEPFANPRNLTAGTIRRKKSSETAQVPLAIFVYEGFWKENPPFADHVAILAELKALGFRTNPNIGLFCQTAKEAKQKLDAAHLEGSWGSFSDLQEHIRRQTEGRASLPYEIDGLVLKVNEIHVRERLGYTEHHPRWAIAYKFEAPQALSTVQQIDVQIGRTGRVTPVARITPVAIGGSTVSNVTLHNQQYIDELELAVGDTVEVSKRGDVIPAVERVVDKNEQGNTTYHIPSACPVCDTVLVQRGSHHFCPNPDCRAQMLGRIEFFVGKDQMDIASFGPKTVEFLVDRKLVKDVPDLYSVNYSVLMDAPGFGDKKVAAIQAGIEASKKQPFSRVLVALGMPEIGKKVVDMLIEAGFDSMDKLLDIAAKKDKATLATVRLIADKTADNLIDSLNEPAMQERIAALRAAGLPMKMVRTAEPSLPKIFEGQVWCVTGSFQQFNPRTKAMEEVEKRGGRVVSAITGKTTHLLCGTGGGSKRAKAEKLGIKLVDEAQFLALLGESNGGDPAVPSEQSSQMERQGELF
ncbi:MAG: NAD-dependent DNA ligase LigA [Spirochaetia bacterium]|nr:NAD-dependent DNA ligase LigA [Spirochaetia bacterium]